ncbi:hypothetical protein N7497_008324 [Penicillium chrysogenum]|uniref:NWD NACHT-NTPase N-terminal domain-containing protein n=1 Tax=Penicillium chrysogenum TaxID=5076 RepID=A0ABQ8WLM2_PENCH|nr:hypothetical protein N7524_012223 [Penicillium chrysogenum]KAJ5270904.1 hypothetical protein N7505_006662 [Penicillium chrysogenum]KAJ6146342.1 hypothetical protein N7497_008324 [Penicillium chrysogenum]
MKWLPRFRPRKANSGDPKGNSAVAPSPPVGPEMIAPSTNSIPASSLSEQATSPSVVDSSPFPTAVCAAQLQAGQAAASISPSAGSPPAPSTSAVQDIDIWTTAYEVVENREPELMTDYASHLASIQGNPTTRNHISSSEFVEDVVKQLLEEREKKQWRLPLLGNNVIIRKQAERLAKVLLWADPVVKRAVSTQPYAALAWSSVSILLPLLTGAATPDVAMLKGFNSISDVQVYWAIFEETYLSSSHRQHYENLIEPLAKLYSYIIEYQARAICHLSKTQLSRGWQNVAGEDDWAEKASEIEALSEARSSLISHDNETEIRERWGRQLREIQESSAILKEIRQVLDETRRQTQGNYEDKAEKDLLHDLASDYEGYKDFNRLRVQGTCEWFFNDEKFCKWRDSNTSGLLWLSAGPGCGKSILSRALIDERRLSLNVTTSTVCHFFFKDGYEDRMYSVNALCAVLHQLFSHDPSGALIKLALPAHKNYGKSLVRNFSELWNILLDCAKSPHAGEIVCIFDALDECEQQSRLQLISKLKDFYCQPQGSSALSSKLSFLITSRPYAEIERNFSGFSTTEYLHFDGDKKSVAITREIDLVIDDHVSQIIGNFTANDQLEISKRLKTMENRTYLWLYVIFETIKEDPSRHGKRSSVEKLLNNIPSKLSEAYEKILGRSRCQEETQHLLEIILAAARPLTLDEANVALTLALAEEDSTSHSALENDLWPKNNFESIVKGLSGLFISVHDSKLFFIHQTAREFLIDPSGRGTWEGRLSMSKSSRTISRTCFKFLMLPDLRASVKDADFWDDDDYDLNDPNHVTLEQLPPFFCYAADHWPSHFLSQGATDIDQSLKDARTLCNRHQAWVWVTASGWTPGGRLTLFHHMTDLSLASYFGLKQVVENILTEEHIDVNTEDESSTLALRSSRSALSAACLGGKSDVVTLLLDKGANVNSYHKLHATALYTALVYGHQDIVPILLEKGADVNITGEHHGTALYMASHLGNPDIVLSILERGADINYNHKWHGTALYRACRSGHPKVVKILLENGANVNIGDRGYGSALLAASTHNCPDIVIDLLKKDADTDYNNQKYGTALRMASGHGWQNVVEVLLAHGADPNIRGTEYGSSPIQVASFFGHQGAVEELLKHGADVNFPDQQGNTALLAAARQGHREIVSMLLRCGADVTVKGERYGTALNAATEAGHTEIIEMLAKRGAKV